MCKQLFLKEKEIEDYLDYVTSGSVTVASYLDYGIDVILYYGEHPTIVVTQDDIIIYSSALFKGNIAGILGYIEDEFLTESGVVRNFLDEYGDDHDDDDYERDSGIPFNNGIQSIEDREDELDMLVFNFIDGITDGDDLDEITDEVLQDCKEHFLEYIYTKHGIQAYRPMVLCDETGNEMIFDYPYAYVCGEA